MDRLDDVEKMIHGAVAAHAKHDPIWMLPQGRTYVEVRRDDVETTTER